MSTNNHGIILGALALTDRTLVNISDFTSTSPRRERIRRRWIPLAAAFVAIGCILPVRAADRFVSPRGDDKQPGTLEQPFRTLQKAANVIKPGDTIYLREGIHNDSPYAGAFSVMVLRQGGTRELPVTITRYRDPKTGRLEDAIIETFHRDDSQTPASYPRVFGCGIEISASWIHLKDLVIVGNQSVVSLEEAKSWERTLPADLPATLDESTKRRLRRGMAQWGINLTRHDATAQAAQHITIERCFLTQNTMAAIAAGAMEKESGPDYITIRNNIIAGNCQRNNGGSSAVNFFGLAKNDGSTGVKIIVENNVIYDNENLLIWARTVKNRDGSPMKDADGKIILSDYNQGYSDGNGIIMDWCYKYTGTFLIRNNIVFDNGGGGICVTKSSNVQVFNNTVYRNSRSPYLSWGNIMIVQNPSEDIVVRDNIVWAREGKPLFFGKKHGVDGVVYEGNVYFREKSTPPPQGSLPKADVYFDPGFIAPEKGDFRLSAGSPAGGKGVDYSKFDLPNLADIPAPYVQSIPPALIPAK